jgi:flagella basal body P-ring formation protein FlgA
MPLSLLPILLAAGLAAGAAMPAAAAEPESSTPRQTLAAIQQAVQEHLRRETRGLPGKASFTVGAIDPRLNLAACAAPETFAAPGARPWGRTSVGVRCAAEARWAVFVPVTIHVEADYAVAARPLALGETLRAEDLVMLRGDLAQLPAGVVTDRSQAVGRKAAASLGAGQPLRSDMLRAPVLIQQGQVVRVVSRGKGFQVSTQGQAVGSAQEGQVVQVRAAGGQVLSGVARPGPVVEVADGG